MKILATGFVRATFFPTQFFHTMEAEGRRVNCFLFSVQAFLAILTFQTLLVYERVSTLSSHYWNSVINMQLNSLESLFFCLLL